MQDDNDKLLPVWYNEYGGSLFYLLGDRKMKVAIYCRLSEEDRNKQFETDDSGSIQNQKSMLLQYAMNRGGSFTTFTATTTMPEQTDADHNSTVY